MARMDDAQEHHAEPPGKARRPRWWVILLPVKDELSDTNVSLVAAGLAFFAFLAIPAALTALVALYGLAFDPVAVSKQIDAIQGIMPAEAFQIVTNMLTSITSSPNSKLSVAFGMSVILALWSTHSGIAWRDRIHGPGLGAGRGAAGGDRSAAAREL
jgi:membrane protein